MKSRQATKSVIEKDTGYLITFTHGGMSMPIAVSKNVKDAYAFAKLTGQLTEPNRSYKGTIRQLKKYLKCTLWNTLTYGEPFPPQDYVEIRPIKIL